MCAFIRVYYMACKYMDIVRSLRYFDWIFENSLLHVTTLKYICLIVFEHEKWCCDIFQIQNCLYPGGFQLSKNVINDLFAQEYAK